MVKKKTFPITDIKQNMVLVKEDTVWAYYKVPSDFVMSIDDTTKQKLKLKTEYLLNDMIEKYQELDIRLLPRDMTLSERFNSLLEDVPQENVETVKQYLDRTVNLVEQEMGQSFVYEWLIGLPLTNLLLQNTKNSFLNMGKKFVNGVADYLGYTLEASDWLTRYTEVEEQAYIDLASLNVSRVSEEEMYYLTRLNLIRNMPHTMQTEQINCTLTQAIDGVLDFSKLGQVHLGNYNGESYIASLPLSETDHLINDLHLAELAQCFGFPVELQYQVFYEPIKAPIGIGGLETKLTQSQRRLKNINEESYEASGEVSQSKFKNKDVLDDMQHKIEEKELFVGWTATLVVYGASEKELSRRIADVIAYFNKQNVYFVRGTTEQYELFMRGFFGQVMRNKSYWYQMSTSKSFAENLLFTNNRVGTKTGFYIGRVDTNFKRAKNLESALYNSSNLVLFNPTIVNKGLENSKTDSPHIAVTGETGKGKSFLINLLHFYLSFFTKSLYIDVKNEKKERYLDVINDKCVQAKYPYLVKHIKDNFEFVTLNADEEKYHGVLDPIIFLTGSESKVLSETIFNDVYNFENKDLQNQYMLKYLNEVIEERRLGKLVGLMTVVERLIKTEDKEVSQCGLLIKEKVNGSILKLLFGNETSQALSFESKHIILGFHRLDLPQSDTLPQDYKPSQKYAVLIMYALGYFTKKFGSNPHEFTVAYNDETSIYLKTSVGRQIINEMKRVGRSFNNALVLGTQSVLDFGSEEDKGNFGSFFAFDEPSERKEILKHLRLPITSLNEVYLDNLIKGQCLFLDNYGRCQKITIHCPFEEVRELFKTVNRTNQADNEEKFV